MPESVPAHAPRFADLPADRVGVEAALPVLAAPAAGRRDPRPGLSGLPVELLVTWFSERGHPAYRARQLADHVWSGRAESFEEMRTLPAAVRTALNESYRLDTLLDTSVRPADQGLT